MSPCGGCGSSTSPPTTSTRGATATTRRTPPAATCRRRPCSTNDTGSTTRATGPGCTAVGRPHPPGSPSRASERTDVTASARASDGPRALARPELTISVNGVAPIGQGAISGGGTHTAADGTTTRRPAYHKNGDALGDWRDAVALAARVAMSRAGWTPVPKPPAGDLPPPFSLPRPKSVSIAARPYPTVSHKGAFDTSHLVRAIEDALS